MTRLQRIYQITEGELWSLMLFGWLALPIFLLIRRETTFDDEGET